MGSPGAGLGTVVRSSSLLHNYTLVPLLMAWPIISSMILLFITRTEKLN